MRSLACRRCNAGSPAGRYAVGVVVVLAAGGLAAWLIWGRAPEDVSNPDAEFTAPTEEPKPEKRKPKDFVWPIFGYTPDRAKYFPTQVVKPPFKQGVARTAPTACSSSRRCWRTRRSTWSRTRARPSRVNADNGKRPLAPPRRHPERGLAGLVEGPAVHGDARRARHARCARRTARCCGRRTSRAAPSRRRYVRNGRVYFGSEDGTVYAVRAKNGQHDLDLRRERRGEGRARVLGPQALLRRLRRRRLRDPGERRQRGLEHRRPPGSRWDGAATSTRPPPWHSGASTWGTRTGACTRSPPAAARPRGRSRPGPTSTRARRRRRSAAAGRPSSSAPTPAASTRSTPAPARSDGRSSRRAGSPAPSSVIGPVVYFANLETRETHGLDVRTGKEVFRHKGGGFAPPISDGETLYLTGYATQLAFKPRKEASSGLRVRDVELVKRIEAAGIRKREGAPDRAAVTDAQGGQRPARGLRERRGDPLGVLRQRLAAGEAEVCAAAPPRRPAARAPRARSPRAAGPPSSPRLDSASRSSTIDLEPQLAGDDLGGLARAREVARVNDREPTPANGVRERARLRAAAVVQRRVDPALHPRRRHVVVRLAVAGEQDHFSWKSFSVSARRPRRRVSSESASSGRTLPRLTCGPEHLDEAHLLVLARRLEDQLRLVDLVDDLVDQARPRLAVGPVHAGVAGDPPLADHLRRARLERLPDQLDPAVGREQRLRVLLADLGEDREVGGELLDQGGLLLQTGSGRCRSRPRRARCRAPSASRRTRPPGPASRRAP